jgi:hypothetical protein
MSWLSEFLGGGGDNMDNSALINASAPVHLPLPDQPPPWADMWQNKTVPAFQPGAQEELSNQLAFGGFGTPQANSEWLGNIYKPAASFNYGPGRTPAPAAPAAAPAAASAAAPAPVAAAPASSPIAPSAAPRRQMLQMSPDEMLRIARAQNSNPRAGITRSGSSN